MSDYVGPITSTAQAISWILSVKRNLDAAHGSIVTPDTVTNPFTNDSRGGMYSACASDLANVVLYLEAGIPAPPTHWQSERTRLLSSFRSKAHLLNVAHLKHALVLAERDRARAEVRRLQAEIMRLHVEGLPMPAEVSHG